MRNNSCKEIWDCVYGGDVSLLPWIACNNNAEVCAFLQNHVVRKNGEEIGVLDVGCGTGDLAVKLADNFHSVIGVDVSQNAIDKCNALPYRRNVKFMVGDVLDNRLPSKLKLSCGVEAFDIVVAQFLLHEIEGDEIDEVCNCLSSLVKPNGWLYLSWLVQGNDCGRRVREGLYAGKVDYKVTYYSRDEIAKKFDEIDFCDGGIKKLLPSEEMMELPRQKNIQGFTCQILLGRKIAGRIGTGVKKGQSRQEAFAAVGGSSDWNKICERASDSIFSWFLNDEVQRSGISYNVYINFQIGSLPSDLVSKHRLFPISQNSTVNGKRECETRAGFLVQYFRTYKEKSVAKQKLKKFLAHDFFRTHARLDSEESDSGWVQRLIFFWGHNDHNTRGKGELLVKVNNGAEELFPCSLEEFFIKFKINNTYDLESYLYFIRAVLGDVQDNPFVDYVNKVAGDNVLAQYPALDSYTLYNLSIPGHDYIGSVIIESWNGAVLLDENARECIKDISYATKLTIQGYRYRVKSIKSAIGSIMSRNGSHNIGSHVLAALSHNVGTLPDDRVLYQYIQQRMDYIATVTTDFPTWTQPTMFVADMMKTFLSQRHLLDHIVESEGLRAFQFQNPNMTDEEWKAQENCVKIHIRRKKGKEYKELIDYTKRDAKVSLQDGTEECDISLAIPGGIIGEHAFYTILENIIRNAAKHSWATENNNAKNLDVYIDLTDEDEKVKFNVYAKLETSKCKKLVDELKKRLSQSFIDEDTGALRRENWGLAEMKISAGYLAGASIEAIGGIGDKKGTNEIIKPYVKSSKYLGYEFFIAKPKEILIIVKNENENKWNDKKGVMKKSGIFVKTIKEAKEELKLNYRYIVHYDATEFFDLKTKEPKEGILIPFRMLSGESVSSKSISQADKQNDGKKQDWEWLQPFVADLDDGVEKVENGNGFGQLKEAFENGLVDGVRKIVYKAYYEHLRKSRNDFWSKCDNRNNEYDIKEIGLLVAINENEKAGGNSLISDADILELMLEQNFAVCVDQYKAFAANEDNRKIIKCLESIRHRSSAKDKVIKFKHLSNKTIRELIAQRMCDWAGKSNDSWIPVVEHLRKKYFVSDVEKSETSNELKPNNNEISVDFAASVNSLLQKHPIDDFIRYVESIFENTKKLFKQYEEQIVTLPAGYKIDTSSEVKQEDKQFDNKCDASKEIALDGVEIVTNIEDVKNKDRHWIGYRRHAHTLSVDDSKRLYVEPLSGTQTYLSQLARVKTDLGLQMRLIENGLMRILVLDERVAKFLREHQKEVGPHYKAMNINVIDDKWVEGSSSVLDKEVFFTGYTKEITNALEDFAKNAVAKINAQDNKNVNNKTPVVDVLKDIYIGGESDYENEIKKEFINVDILIVHQGILDKWFSDLKSVEGMKYLLEGFKRLVKYVVVTTGRGTPENIPEEAHLLPFAVVESTLFKKYPEKLILTDTIMNVLPVGKKNDNSGGQE